jgi:Family of unknown function (DUF6535)
MGLFSAALAALLSITVQDLKPNSQDRSTFYLENINKLQFLADSNASHPSTPAQPPLFSAPKYAIWVNSLWFMSLCISLSGTMLATLQQQWVCRFLRLTQASWSGPHDQAWMCGYVASRFEDMGLSKEVDAIPFMIQSSLFLFFAGLLIYLFNTNHAVFSVVLYEVYMITLFYLSLTLYQFSGPNKH